PPLELRTTARKASHKTGIIKENEYREFRPFRNVLQIHQWWGRLFCYGRRCQLAANLLTTI
ncbi:MAG: hypothetical protein Q4D38_08950, partial [Planctomycetia bacterium]|nr:hypothetical protein [Planctomycetia bacterium]